MDGVVISGFSLGLSTGSWCLASCVPVALPYLVSQGESVRASGRAVAELAAGRLAAYLLLGFAAALVGTRIESSAIGKTLVAASMIALAVVMVAYGLKRNFPESPACERIGRWTVVRRFPFAAGLLMGVNLCPPILLCMADIMSLNNLLLGLLLALCFFLGTLVFLLPLAFAGLLGRSQTLKGLASVAALFCGIWFLAKGVSLLI